ncbi:rab11 family-interacting protein 3 [Pungitius pungitius]|uniref:rab11 family-interacting protein 3 n=1 Tax=Pungitius pungitius TaxID=134920 RepID=UPI002E162EF0
MEASVLSGPLGHTQWDSEPAFPLGFHPPGSDNGGDLCPNTGGRTGLDFRDDDRAQTFQPSEGGNIYQDKPVELDNLINILDFSCGGMQFEGDQSNHSKAPLHDTSLIEPFTDKTPDLPDELNDYALSWLFSPKLTDVVGQITAHEDPSLTQGDLLETSNAFSTEARLISLSPPVIPSKTPGTHTETNTGDRFLLVDLLSDGLSCLPPESLGELNPQGVSEELVDLSQEEEEEEEEEAGLPPSQRKETLSHETRDNGSLPDQVTDLPLTWSRSQQGLPENHLPPDKVQPLLDSEVPDCDGSLSLRPASPPALIRTGVTLDLPAEESEGGRAAAAGNRSVTSERRGENDSFALRSPAEPSSLTAPLAEDVFARGGFNAPSCSVDKESTDLMEGDIDSEAQNQGNRAMALDLCLTAEEVRGEETWDVKPRPDVQNGSVLHPRDEERTAEEASLDFSVQDLHASPPEAGWTTERTVETISLSEMAADDSLPAVSAVNATGEDASPLKAVFDALDQDGDGFVRIEEFMEFAAAYGADQVKDLTKFLDPSGLGVISFEDFHRGISAISNGGTFLREEALDFFCSQCHKQISRLEDLSTRLNFLEMTSAGKRLSSKKVARHLLQNSSMTLDTVSDLTRDILELADNDITDKVLLLERRVAELEKESELSGEQHARLRQDNLHLVHRANALEEQLKEQELHADEQLQQETRRHKEALIKLERERGVELENLQARLQQLDEENSELRSCVPCLRANIERLEEEKRKLQDETDAMADKLEEETESRRKMADKLSHERHHSGKEKECTQELIEDLRKQLEHLQLYKLEAEAKRGRTPGAGLQEYQTRTREAELEQEIKRLKQDNRSLKEQNDELNGQIINLSIQGAKNLMSASFSDSLAAEINNVSRVELMETVHKQEEINYRLQDYIDKIIVAIMECNPSILEVK